MTCLFFAACSISLSSLYIYIFFLMHIQFVLRSRIYISPNESWDSLAPECLRIWLFREYDGASVWGTFRFFVSNKILFHSLALHCRYILLLLLLVIVGKPFIHSEATENRQTYLLIQKQDIVFQHSASIRCHNGKLFGKEKGCYCLRFFSSVDRWLKRLFHCAFVNNTHKWIETFQ